jgi:L,D-peptidoglycan transpeptidase YkuD (ErfK/YbiS/YcfS/YnhG family)
MATQEYASPEAIVRNPDVFYKVGYTETPDAEYRFSEEYHNQYGFRGRCLGKDYKPRCVWSAYFSKDEANLREAEWKNDFPKNLWVDKVEDQAYNGITECRYMDTDHYKRVLNRFRLKYPKDDYGFKQGYYKVYLMEFTKRK